jgi:hypothetical protein
MCLMFCFAVHGKQPYRKAATPYQVLLVGTNQRQLSSVLLWLAKMVGPIMNLMPCPHLATQRSLFTRGYNVNTQRPALLSAHVRSLV